MKSKTIIKFFVIAAMFAAILTASLGGNAPSKSLDDTSEPVLLQSDTFIDNTINDTLELIVEATPVAPAPRNMPMYLQGDPQWGDMGYAGSTMEQAGCGLVCASMAIEYLTGQTTLPSDLLNIVGDSCLTGGVNDPGKFCSYAESAYGLDGSEIYWTIDDAIAECSDGAVVFAGMRGQLGGQGDYYGGHVVLIWQGLDGGMYIQDPNSVDNSQRLYSIDELYNTQWLYFYSLRSIK